MKKKNITYKYEIRCEVDEHGNVIPKSGSEYIVDGRGKSMNMLEYPEPYKITLVWLGIYFRYPQIKK